MTSGPCRGQGGKKESETRYPEPSREMKPTPLGLAFKAHLFHPEPAFPASSPSAAWFFLNKHTSQCASLWAFAHSAPSAWDALPLHFFSKIQLPPLEALQDFPAVDVISALRSHGPSVWGLPFRFTTSITVLSRLAARGVFGSDCHKKWLEHSQEAAAGSGGR